MAQPDKECLTLLKFAASAGHSGLTWSPPSQARAEGRIQNKRGERRTVRSALVENLLQSGSLKRVDMDGVCHLKLTKPGQAHLRRMICDTDAYAAQHRTMVSHTIPKDECDIDHVLLNAQESPLLWLYKRKTKSGRAMIDPAQFAAGERLRSDYERAQMRQRVSANWEAALSGGKRGASKGGQDITDAAMDARQRVDKAMVAVGAEFSGVLSDVCCQLKGLADVERERQWPQRSAKIVLSLALRSLARHYGFTVEHDRNQKGSGIRSWGDGSHRPDLTLPT